MKIVVGLGNPGPKYAGTRHNVGFEVIDYLAASPKCSGFCERFESFAAEWQEGSETLLFLKPLTFMNLSGQAVRGALEFYKLPIESLLVICDDFNLPLGKLRIRGNGSHGGQNGLRNIQAQLGTDGYSRLRIGVGQPGPGEAIDFVLSRFKPAEKTAIGEAVASAAQAAIVWASKGLAECMNRFNGGGDPPAAKKKPPRPNRESELEKEKGNGQSGVVKNDS